jgi:cobalt-zinc-cadmium efflux system outer membrane protein
MKKSQASTSARFGPLAQSSLSIGASGFPVRLLAPAIVIVSLVGTDAAAQAPLTWQQIRARFGAVNPIVRAGRLGVDESRATEITAYLRPNPQAAFSVDQFPLDGDATDPSQNLITVASFTYLHERQHKRELRRDSAKGATAVAEFAQGDTVRNLLFSLRAAFIQILQAKAFQALAQENLSNYDQVIAISRERLQNGDIAQIDFDRIQLQRVQYESDIQTADVNLRTAKIQLLRLLDDGTAVDQFDVTGVYDFAEPAEALASLRQVALDTRPDLRAAQLAIEKAVIDNRLATANGSVDPTIGLDVGHQQTRENSTPPLSTWIGVNVSLPLRVFDQNQGEKLRTQLDITRNGQLLEAMRVQVLSDVDSGYATVMSTLALLRPYKTMYLDQATRVRDTMTFSYQSGGASLIDFLQAQQEYRAVQVSYLNLVAAFLNAVNQLNLAVGREVIP